jgi:hypothetical protein
MKNSLFILLIFTFFALQCNTYAQENFIKGFVISSNGDTLRGLINYKNWEKNPRLVQFKIGNNDTKKSYSPNDIKGFGVNNVYYESAIVQLEVTRNSTIYLIASEALEIKVDTLFLEAIIRGKKSLYAYKSDEIREQFYIKNGSNFDLLIYKKYLKEKDNKTIITANTSYLGQLSMYLQDMSDLQSSLRSVDYTLESLKKLFNNYYQRDSLKVQSLIEYQQKYDKIAFKFGVFAGISNFNMKFNGSNFPELINGNFSASINPLAGISLDIVFPKNRRRWAFRNEIGYSSFQTKGTYLDYSYPEKYISYETKFDYSYLKLINMIRYSPFIGKFSLYLSAGISNGFAFKKSNILDKRTVLFSMNRLDIEDPLRGNSRGYEQSYLVGIGVNYQKYTFETRYENGNGMSNYPNLGSLTDRLSFIVGYSF